MILEIALAALLSCDPRLTALFTPVRPILGRYEVCTTPAPLADAVAATAGLHAAAPETIDAVDAFGAAGPYDRGALNRLYDGRRVRVVRGWRETDGQEDALTFISPYPNAALTELNGGTLVVVFHTAANAIAELQDCRIAERLNQRTTWRKGS